MPVLSQVKVINGAGPRFPVSVDSSVLVVRFIRPHGALDSSRFILDSLFPAMLVRGIDSTFTYVEATYRKRPELKSCKGPLINDRYILMMRRGVIEATVTFRCGRSGSALVSIKDQRYPFLVLWKADFASRMRDLIGGKRRGRTGD